MMCDTTCISHTDLCKAYMTSCNRVADYDGDTSALNDRDNDAHLFMVCNDQQHQSICILYKDSVCFLVCDV